MESHSLISPRAMLIGPVSVGEGCIIEAGTVIGHPAPEGLIAESAVIAQCSSPEEWYAFSNCAPVHLGAGTVIRTGTVIYEGVEIGERCDVGHYVLIRERVRIGSHTYIKSYTEIMKECTIGASCRIAGTVADRSTLGDLVNSFGILTHKFSEGYYPGIRELGPTVGEGATIGRGSVIVGPVLIGPGSVVAAGAVVVQDVPAGELICSPTAQPKGKAPQRRVSGKVSIP